TTASTPAMAAVIATGNMVEGLFGAWLVRRYAGGEYAFRHTAGILRFVGLAGFGATLVGPTVGVTAVVAGGGAPWPAYASIWLTWWLGDAAGAVIVTPLIVLWARPIDWNAARRRAGECAILLALLGVFGQLVFGWYPPHAVAG